MVSAPDLAPSLVTVAFGGRCPRYGKGTVFSDLPTVPLAIAMMRSPKAGLIALQYRYRHNEIGLCSRRPRA